jgi:tRNA-2-methylthio-N6-dimethylallyladenosine synthase
MFFMSDKTFHITTFGCQMNVNDSDWLRRALLSLGFTEAPFEKARIHILNTCSVREKPEHKVYTGLGRIRLLSRKFPERDIIACVGGCVAQQLGEKLFAKSKELKLLFGTDGIAHTPAAIALLAENSSQSISLLDFSSEYAERHTPKVNQTLTPLARQAPTAFVNIMQGCDNFCTYCIVPFVRGRQKSRKIKAVLEECTALTKNGCKEITLLGQNVNSFGLDKNLPAHNIDASDANVSFASLLYQVADIPGLERLRFITPHPKDMPDEVIAAFARLPVLAPRLHLPLQSGSDHILKRMNRKYDFAHYMNLVHKLKAARPDMQFSTDIIVGFPGETEADFSATLQAMREADFAASFSFVYSDRPGAKASEYNDKVPPKEALERLSRLQRWQDANTERILQGLVGTEAEVLIEGASRKAEKTALTTMPNIPNIQNIQGRDAYGFSVNIPVPQGRQIHIGEMVKVSISGAGRHTLKGSLKDNIL